MKPVTLLLTLLSLSCSHITPVEQQILDCGSQAVQQQLPNLLQQVNGILQSGNVNWQDSLNALLATAGSAVVCAVEVAVSDLEHSNVNSPQASYVAVARGEAWLANHPGMVTGQAVKPPAPTPPVDHLGSPR